MVLDILKALADNTRLRLMLILDQGEYTVQELTAILSMGQSRISRHLKILRDAGLLEVQHQGTWNYYRRSMSANFPNELWASIRRDLSDFPDALKDRDGVARVYESRRSRSRLFFDQVVDQGNNVSGKLLPTMDYRSTLLSRVPTVETLVEVGIGDGSLLIELAGSCRSLIGIDQSSAILNSVAERLIHKGITHQDLRLGDMSHLPLPDARADVLILNMVLHHAPNPAAVLLEIFRVLCPHGLLILADYSTHEHDWVRDGLADQWLGFASDDLEAFILDAGFEHLEKHEFPAVEKGAGVLLFSAHKVVNKNHT